MLTIFCSPKCTAMAEIQNASDKKNRGGQRSKKQSTRVDLTPMVDLGFLLITFFVFTTTMSKPHVLGLDLPDDRTIVKDPPKIQNSAVLSVLLDDHNTIHYYRGEFADAQKNGEIVTTTFAAQDLRKAILNAQQQTALALGDKKKFLLIIKPGKKSSYKNLIDAMDEYLICDVKKYALLDVSDEEKKMYPDL
jgi:biopolymer transport protein ExbD